MITRIYFAPLVFILAGCAGVPPVPAELAAGAGLPATPSVITATPGVPVPDNANFVLAVSEVVSSPEEDVLSQTRIFIDGAPAGETNIGLKSLEKRWGATLPSGNHLFRFEVWAAAGPEAWGSVDPDRQPPERFFRVEADSRTTVFLRFSEGGRRSLFEVSREPLR